MIVESPLRSTLTNFYIGYIENEMLETSNIMPSTYTRHVYNIYLNVESEVKLQVLTNKFKEMSGLKFTYEISDILNIKDKITGKKSLLH